MKWENNLFSDNKSPPNERKEVVHLRCSAKLEVMLPKYQAALERTSRCNLRHKLQNKTHTRLSRAIVIERKFNDGYLSTKTRDYTEDTAYFSQ